MALLWNDRYKVGDDKADVEHQEWFRFANDFLVSDDRQSRIDSGEAFARYTRQHFFTEEATMREVQYPSMATHCNDHDRLLSTLDKIFEADVNEVLSMLELEEFIGYTLIKHISTFDAPLAVYVKRSCKDAVM